MIRRAYIRWFENEHLAPLRFLDTYLLPRLLFPVRESAQTATFAFSFVPTFRRVLQIFSLRVLLYYTATQPARFCFSLRGAVLRAGQAENGGRNSKTNSTAQKRGKKRKKERKEREKKSIANGEGKRREKKFIVANGASSVPALYTRGCWILRESTRCSRRFCSLFPFSWLHVPRFLSSLFFSLPSIAEDGY